MAAWVAKRVDMLLQQTARLGLRSKAACVSYLGQSFRTPLQLSETKSDHAVSFPQAPFHIRSVLCFVSLSDCRVHRYCTSESATH